MVAASTDARAWERPHPMRARQRLPSSIVRVTVVVCVFCMVVLMISLVERHSDGMCHHDH